MKKLLATTALVGAAFAAPAYAAGPTVTVGGVADFQVGVADQDNAYQTAGTGNTRDVKFANDTEIHVNAEGQADNGLVYGATVELEADVSGDVDGQGGNADKTFLYVQGDFGRAEMGSNTDAAAALKVDASTIARATGGINGDFYRFINVAGVGTGGYIIRPDLPTAHGGTALGTRGALEDANKLTYYSPRFSGVQLGVSYTPDQGDTGTALTASGDDGSDQENVFNLGVNYTGQFNELGVAASATGEFGTNETDTAANEDLNAYAFGLNLSYRGFSAGGSWGDWQDSAIGGAGVGNDGQYWTLGAAYEQGPAGVSVTYLDSEYANNEFTNLSVGADYQLAPGLVPYVEVNFFDVDPTTAGAVSNDGNVILVGTELTF
jgi:outer membrane protein OmpU